MSQNRKDEIKNKQLIYIAVNRFCVLLIPHTQDQIRFKRCNNDNLIGSWKHVSLPLYLILFGFIAFIFLFVLFLHSIPFDSHNGTLCRQTFVASQTASQTNVWNGNLLSFSFYMYHFNLIIENNYTAPHSGIYGSSHEHKQKRERTNRTGLRLVWYMKCCVCLFSQSFFFVSSFLFIQTDKFFYRDYKFKWEWANEHLSREGDHACNIQTNGIIKCTKLTKSNF